MKKIYFKIKVYNKNCIYSSETYEKENYEDALALFNAMCELELYKYRRIEFDRYLSENGTVKVITPMKVYE